MKNSFANHGGWSSAYPNGDTPAWVLDWEYAGVFEAQASLWTEMA